MNSSGRNAPCPCGSGKKYKHCCLKKTTATPDAAYQTVDEAIQAALQYHNTGNLAQAEAIYRHVLKENPNHPDALFLQGKIAYQGKRYREAAELINHAIHMEPNNPDFYNASGAVQEALNDLGAAASCYQKALMLDPNCAEAHRNLMNVLKKQGKYEEAQARHLYDQGHTLIKQGKFSEAVECYREVLGLLPDHAGAHFNMGIALDGLGKYGKAAISYQRALELDPTFADAHFHLGNVLKDMRKLDEAVACYHRALANKPDFANAYSNLLYTYSYHSMLSPSDYLELARGWELACISPEDRQMARNRTFSRAPQAGRRLKVGYVSGDYWGHAVSYFIERLFAAHDRSRVELFAYSANKQDDAVTKRLQAKVDHWVPIADLPDSKVLGRISNDHIDVLVDLSGHTGHNRMGVFARRAAPVQAHYLGYMASTGLTEMDYWIGDAILTPAGTDSHFSEQVWRLPRVWISYDGKTEAPHSGWQPSPDGTIWLGSFNNLSKLTPATMVLWAKVLHVLPQAKLLLKTKELASPFNRQDVLDAMSAQGIPSERIELKDSSATPSWPDHMAYYDRLDIALDPVGGVGGGTTTCDALWMGVPVITLEGDRMATRMTASMLDAIGHPEWVARSEAEYVEKVVALARDVEGRKALRLIQREHMAASPLCDARGLAESLENAYFEMFGRWLKKEHGRSRA